VTLWTDYIGYLETNWNVSEDISLSDHRYQYIHCVTRQLPDSVAYREGGFGVFKPPPEIPKISVESSIAQARRNGVLISFCSSLCSHRVVIY